MNVIKIKIDFEKGLCQKEGISVVTGDYNSTKIEFEFNESAADGRKIFELKNSDDELVYVDEIVNNEVILVGKREEEGEEKLFSLFNKEGDYTFEVSLYGENSKLTSVYDYITARKEQVIVDDETVEQYMPLFDNLMQELSNKVAEADSKIDDIDQAIEKANQAVEDAEQAVESTNNLNIDVSDKVGKDVTVTLTKKDATTKVVTLSDGTSLMFNWSGTSLGIKTDEDEEYTYVDLQGIQGPVGPMGAPFTIKKTYATIQLMIADYDNMNVGDYVMIDGNVEQQDNATLWVKEETEDPTYKWHYLADFSGATGIQGPTGLTPNIQIGTVVSGATPSVTRTGTNENPVLNFTLVKGDKGDTGNTGATGNGISSVAKTGASGLVDTYTITYTNGNTSTFTVTNGNGIASIAKTSSAGLIDTYTITFTDGTTSTFNITNGQDGDVTQEYVDEENERLKSVFNVLPKVSDSGESIELENTGDTMLYKMDLKGNTSQEVVQGEVGLEVEDTSIYVDDVNEDKENYVTLKGNTYQETTSISGGDQYDSPSPDYPQEIEVVTGLNEVKVEGKNLFNKNSGIEYGKFYTSTGDVGTDNDLFLQTIYIPVNSSTQYTISGSYNDYFRICEYDKDKNFIQRDLSDNTTTSFTITTTAQTKYVRISCFNRNLSSLQFEKGSTATTYEAYKGQTYPINLGSIELCKIGTYQDKIYKNNGNWYLHKEVGKLSYSGNDYYSFTVNSVANDFVQFLTPAIDIIESLPSSVLCNYSVTGGSTASKKIRVNISHSVLGTTSSSTNSEVRTAFINKMSGKTMVFYYPLQTPTETQITDTTLVNQLNALYNATIYSTTHINTETSNLLPYIDLKYNVVTPAPSTDRASEVKIVTGNNTITISNEDGTKTQTFNVNLGSLEFCKIGNYQDYIYYDKANDKWYKYGAIGKTTDIAGSTNITINDMISDSGMYSLYGGTLSGKTITYDSALLRQNTIYYPLTTPTTTQITDQLLVSQLDELQKAMSYYDKTIITQTNADKPFILDVVAIRDLQDIFNLISGE